jgi:hypothetical protein
MFQEERVTNVHALLGEIGTFLDEAPTDKTEQVDWERYPEDKKRARESLDSLRVLFSPDKATSNGCTADNPKIPKIEGTERETDNGCTKTNPQIPKIMSVEVEKGAGCTADNPKIPR